MNGGRPIFLSRQRDQNEPAIVAALEAAGADVERLDLKDAPDLLVGWRGRNFLLEVKTADGRLRPGQAQWHNRWRGAPVQVVRSVPEALAAIGAGT